MRSAISSASCARARSRLRSSGPPRVACCVASSAAAAAMAVAVAAAKGEDHEASEQAGAHDAVDEREARDRRVERLQMLAVSQRDLVGVARDEPQADDAQPDAVDDEPEERAPRRLGSAAPAPRERRPEDARPFLDLPAHEELIRAGLLERQALARGRRASGLEVQARRLGAAPGPSERLGQPHADAESVRRIRPAARSSRAGRGPPRESNASLSVACAAARSAYAAARVGSPASNQCPTIASASTRGSAS